MTKFDIIIPTYGRPDLLRRTLESIARSKPAHGLAHIYVIENGPKAGADVVCDEMQKKLPVVYVYETVAGLSNARNVGAKLAQSDILLFIDDDIRMLEDTLSAYNQAFDRHGPTCFFGGPLVPDYEVAPEPFLLQFLPWSAKGHSLGDHEIEVSKPVFLGGNIAIPKDILFQLGPFDTVCATGEKGGGVGEETRLQLRMLGHSIPGIYVPGALVGHYVPENRCNRPFLRTRSWRTGYGEGQLAAREHSASKQCLGIPCWAIRDLARKGLALAGAYISSTTPSERFGRELALRRSAGYINGYSASRRHDRQT